MALITDPDNLTDSSIDNGTTNFYIDVAAKRLKLVPGVGGLDARDGVVEQAIYSFLKEEWKNDPLGKNLAAIPFPMSPITDEFFELINGWDWADATTEQTIRRGGWLVRNNSGNVTKHFAALAILNAEPDDQTYYDQGAGATDFVFTGPTAEAVQVIDDPNGDGSYSDGYDRSSNIVVYNREQGQLFSSTSSTAVGEASLLAPKLFSLGLPTGADLDIAADDITIAGSAPYTGMTITFFTTPQTRNIGGTNRNFGIIIDGNSGSKQQIYEFVQWALRQAGDQDAGAGSLVGKLMPELLEFVGPTLKTKTAENYRGGGTGVYIDNYSAVDTNDLVFVDNTGAERTFPFVAAGALVFNPQLVGDTDSEYFVFFTDGVNVGSEFGSDGAVKVQDNSGADITGLVSGQAEIPFDFDYDNNSQAGRTPGTDANVTAVAIGLDGAQYVVATAAITRSNANTINFVAALERQYRND